MASCEGARSPPHGDAWKHKGRWIDDPPYVSIQPIELYILSPIDTIPIRLIYPLFYPQWVQFAPQKGLPADSKLQDGTISQMATTSTRNPAAWRHAALLSGVSSRLLRQ